MAVHGVHSSRHNGVPGLLLFARLAALLVLVHLPLVSCVPPGPLPGGPRYTATPNLPIAYAGSNIVLFVRNATIVIDPVARSTFDYFGTYQQQGQSSLQTVHFSGAAVCASGVNDRLLFTVVESTCAASSGISFFCDSAPALYSGVFDFGVGKDTDGRVILEIDKWGGAGWSFLFKCSNSDTTTCDLSTLCNTTLSTTTDFTINGGSINATSSNIFINNGTANFIGDQVCCSCWGVFCFLEILSLHENWWFYYLFDLSPVCWHCAI